MGWKSSAFETVARGCAVFASSSSSAPSEPRSIFVLRNNDIGDLLVVTPLFEALKRRFPHAKIVAGVGEWNRAVLENNPHVDEVMTVSAPWHNQQVRPHGLGAALRYLATSSEVRALAARQFDIGIDVLGSTLGSLLLMRAGIPYRLGMRGYAGGHSAAQQCVQFDPAAHVGRSALRFAELLGVEELPENRPQIFLSESPAMHGAVVIAPGGGFAEKCWPLANFTALVEALAPQRVMILGGATERDAGAQLSARRAHVEDFTGRLSLRESFAKIAGAAAVVCNSSMAMHAAAAFRRPCVVVLGPHFADAPQHAAQWAYPETRVLGRSTPSEVLPIVRELLHHA